jgi:uncharacterized protein
MNFGEIEIDPVELGINGNAILGIKESGKSYLGTELGELMFDAGIPFVAFDPIGIWHNMKVPGLGKGYPIVVAGGAAPDIPLTVASAPAIVEAAMHQRVSLVLDLFDPELSKSDWHKIVRSCADLLLHRNAQHGLRHVFIEEAAEFVPQRPMDGLTYAAVEKLIRMGGNARLGCTLITPRSQEVNKAVLELCENIFLFRQRGKNALENLKKWLDVAGAVATDVMRTLPNLPTGECWAWLGGSDVPVHLHVPAKNSFHPDRRALQGTVAPPGNPVSSSKFVSALIKELPKLEDEAKANDPRALKAEVARLTRELAMAQKASPAAAWPDQRAEVRQLSDEIGRLRSDVNHALGRAEDAESRLGKIGAILDAPVEIVTVQPAPRKALPHSIDHGAKPLGGALPAADPPRTDLSRIRAQGVQPANAVTHPQQRILDALAWWRAFGIIEPTSEQVAFRAGYSASSSGYANLKGAMRTAGLIDYPRPGRLAFTDAGAAVAREPNTPTTREAFHDAVRAKLEQPQLRLLNPLLDAYPDALSSDALADASGYSSLSSGFANLRGRMRTLGFLDYPSPGQVRAADWLFP